MARAPKPLQEMRERIIAEAYSLFRERGFQAVGMRDIAKKVGLTAGALYWYFESKEELVAQFAASTLQEFVLAAEERVRERHGLDRVLALVKHHVEYVIAQSDTNRTYTMSVEILRSLGLESERTVVAWQRRYLELLRTSIVDAFERTEVQTCIDPTLSAFALINMSDGVQLWFAKDGPLSSRKVVEAHVQLARQLLLAVDKGESSSGSVAAG